MVVDLAALAANYRYLSDRSVGGCAGVVKANGYGLGLEPVVRTLAQAGCQDFFVATLTEAIQLRELLPPVRVVLLGGVNDVASAALAAAAGIEPALNSPHQAALWLPHAAAPVTVHVDTGMQRLGFTEAELAADWSGFNVAMLMTHLACADTPAHAMNDQQLALFRKARALLPGVPTSIANSAGCLLPADWHGDLTRPGIGLYGGHPQNRIPENPLTPVVRLEGQVIARRTVSVGTPVGYGGTFVADRTTELAVIGLGYADGLPRLLGSRGQVSISGVRAPIVGRLSMDLSHVDITDLCVTASAQAPDIGDWVEFLGADIGVDEVAQWADTIGLEILCSLGQRPDWSYIR